MSQPVSPRLQQIMAMVEALSLDDQRLLTEMIRQKVSEHRHIEMAKIAETRQSYQGRVHPGAVPQVLRVETIVSNDGTLVIAGLPFQAGDRVEVIVRDRLREQADGQRYPLRGKPIRYTLDFGQNALLAIRAVWPALRPPDIGMRQRISPVYGEQQGQCTLKTCLYAVCPKSNQYRMRL
jgi:hypothetical protein